MKYNYVSNVIHSQDVDQSYQTTAHLPWGRKNYAGSETCFYDLLTFIYANNFTILEDSIG